MYIVDIVDTNHKNYISMDIDRYIVDINHKNYTYPLVNSQFDPGR